MEEGAVAEETGNDFGGLQIAVDIEVILNVFRLGGKGNPSRAHVPIGRVAVVSHDYEAFDHDGFPEVYLAGETITRSRFRKGAECIVAELAEHVGTVSARVRQRLPGISLTNQNLASAQFRYDLRLEDPIKLLSREPHWMTMEGRERLRTDLERLVRDDTKSAFADNVQQLWSHRDIREVSGAMFSRLDRTVRTWGIRVGAQVPAYRAYPHQLYEVVLQFAASERDLLQADLTESSAHVQQLGLDSSALLEMKNISDQVGPGAGLFSAATARKKEIGPFVQWLSSAEQSSPAAANYLRGIVSPGHSATEVELSVQVVLSAFRNPVLGLGERADTEHGIVDTSQFGELEAQFKRAFSVTD